MKEYEIIHEIFNACAGGAKGNVTISEAEIESPLAYVKQLHRDSPGEIDQKVLDSGSLVLTLAGSSITHQYTFTEL